VGGRCERLVFSPRRPSGCLQISGVPGIQASRSRAAEGRSRELGNLGIHPRFLAYGPNHSMQITILRR
jgi:hypothetical protein